MNTVPLLHHLKQQTLLDQARFASHKLKKVLTDCLQADQEDIFIFTDYGKEGSMLSPVLAAGYHLAAKDLSLDSFIISQQQKEKGHQAEAHIESSLEESGYGNILLLVSNSLGSTPQVGKSFRKFARIRRHKFISCTGLSSLPTGLLGPLLHSIDIDYPALWKRAHLLKKALDEAEELRVTTPSGTDLWMNIKGKESHANDGRFLLEGKGGNLPTGEVYLAPRKKQVEGKIVIDGSSRHLHGTVLVKEPITMRVKEGEVVSIEGGREAQLLDKSIAWALENAKHPWGIKRLSEFGLGLNPQARLLGAMIVDEKSLGTAHVAMGSNHWFGGTVYAIIHLDQVFKSPSVEVDGKPLDKKLYT